MKTQKGFSLVELLIVVGIISAITAIAVPAYASYKKKSDVTAGIASVKSLLSSAELHLSESTSNGLVSFVSALGGGANLYDVGLGTIVATDPVAAQGATQAAPGKITFTFKTGQSFASKTLIFTRDNGVWTCAAHADIKNEISDLIGCS